MEGSVKRNTAILKTIITLGVIIIILGAGELLVRIDCDYYTYTEGRGMGYRSFYRDRHSGSKPNSKSSLVTSEYTYIHTYNNEGFRDVNHEVKKGNKDRLVILGDSFIASSGTNDDLTVPRLVERILKESGHRVEVISGGVPGADPVTHLYNLKHRLLKYSPDYLLIMLNISDVLEVITGGGFERFEGYTKRAPRIETLWKISHLFRFFMTQAFGYRDHLLSASGYAREMSKAMAMIVGACQKMGEMVSQQGGKSLIIVSPLPEGILDERDKELEAFHKDVHGAMIDVIDAGPYLKKRVQGPKHLSNLYYPTDRHYTPEGYAIYAEAVSEIIKAELFGAKRTN